MMRAHLGSMKLISCSKCATLLVLVVSASLALAMNSSHLNSHPLIAFSRAFSLPVSPIRIAFTINLLLKRPNTPESSMKKRKADSVLAH